MKIIFIVYIFFLLSIKAVIADTSQAGSGSVGATISKNLTAELRLGKEKVETICSACHGLDGVSASGGNSVIIPNLTAQHKDYLIAKLKDYKSKKLDHPQMTIIAQMLTDEEIAAVSEWYSRIKVKVFDPEIELSEPN